MATEIKRIITDDTGKDIADAINANTVVLEEVRAAIEALPTNSIENYSSTLSKNTPAKIKEAIGAGLYKVLWNVGDTIDITLTTGEVVEMAIMDFDHDAPNSITFGMTGLLETTYAMNDSRTNVGGWDECQMRTETMQELFDLLPAEWQNVMATVEKKASAGDQSTEIVTSEDKLFLLAVAEIWGEEAIRNASTTSISDYADTFLAEGTQYPYFKNLASDEDAYENPQDGLIRYIDGTATVYWLRSPRVSSSALFHGVAAGGRCSGVGASGSAGVAFCFCVKS